MVNLHLVFRATTRTKSWRRPADVAGGVDHEDWVTLDRTAPVGPMHSILRVRGGALSFSVGWAGQMDRTRVIRVHPGEAMTGTFMVTIDTEANAWDPIESNSIANVEHSPALQDIFDRHGIRPTYLVTHSSEVMRGGGSPYSWTRPMHASVTSNIVSLSAWSASRRCARSRSRSGRRADEWDPQWKSSRYARVRTSSSDQINNLLPRQEGAVLEWMLRGADAGHGLHSFVALVDDRIVGHVGYTLSRFRLRDREATGVHVVNWVVGDEYRGRRIGARLFEATFDEGDFSYHFSGTPAAERVYPTIGFTQTVAVSLMFKVLNPVLYYRSLGGAGPGTP